MTRCCRDSVNLKSSVYNQTGESYVDQLSMQRSMGTHLRRVLLAKSVVDSRNPRYTRAMHQKRCRPSSCKLRFLEGCPSDETIDKLAYDTEHHPSEIIKVQCRIKSSSKDRSPSGDRRIGIDVNCPCLRPFTARERSCIIKSNLKNLKRLEDFHHCRSPNRMSDVNPKFTSSPNYSTRLSRRRYRPEEHPRSSSSERSGASPRRSSDQQQPESSRKSQEEETRYAKFVYDITQEIVQHRLYTDRELKEVFEKHLERSSGRLNKRKMLYEIYQLKISLNMMDDSEEEDEVEADLMFAEKFGKLRAPKPPTPPKILNENKVIEKLQSLKHMQENGDPSALSSPGRKSVTLIDANPEFLVTELDVLSTLMDNHVDPEQIQRIYRNLYQRSKDMSLCEAVQVGSEVAYTHRLKQVDRSSSAISLDSDFPKRRSHGILRKESTDFASKSLSPERSYRRSCMQSKENEALEKCARWAISECACKTQPCLKHMEEPEKERKQSPTKISAKDEKLQKKDFSEKKINFSQQLSSNKKTEKVKTTKNNNIAKKEIKSSSDTSELSNNAKETVTDEKRDITSRAENNDARTKSAMSEENEEIEEEIESEIDEKSPSRYVSPNISPRSLKARKEDISDDEVKELSSVQEEDEDASIASESSDGSIKYSDDFSNASESNADKPKSGRSKVDKVRRYSTMKDYFERFATIADEKIWRISEGSSDSTTSSGSSIKIDNTLARYPAEKPPDEVGFSHVVKKRTSSGMNAFKGLDVPKKRVSVLSSDFYINSKSKYCDANCRVSPNDQSCNEHCKFVRTNCRNLSNPTDCLNKDREKLESSEPSDSSS